MNDLSVKIKASLDENASKQKIQAQLTKLQKEFNFKINLTGLSEAMKTSYQDLLVFEKEVSRINSATYDASIRPLKDALTVLNEIEHKLTEISKSTLNVVSQTAQGRLSSATNDFPSKAAATTEPKGLIDTAKAAFGGVKGITSTSKNISEVNKEIETLINKLKALKLGTVANEIAQHGLVGAFKLTESSLKTLTMTLLKSPLFWAVAGTIAITTLVEAVDYLSKSFDRQKEKVEELSSKIIELQSEYERLSSKTDLTESEKKKLELLEAQLEVKKELHKQGAQKLYEEQKSKEDASRISQANKRMHNSQYKPKDNSPSGLVAQYNKIELDLEQNLDDQVILQREINALKVKIQNARDYTNKTDLEAELKSKLPWQKQLEEKNKTLEESFLSLGETINETIILYQGFQDEGATLSDIDHTALDALCESLIKYKDRIKDTTGEETEAVSALSVELTKLENEFKNGNITFDEYLVKLNEIKSVNKEYETEIYNLGKAHEYLSSISEKLSNSQSLTKDEVNQLIAFYPSLQGAIYQTADGWMVEKSAVDLLNEGVGDLRNAYINAQTSMLRTAAITAAERLGISVDELEGIENVADAYRLLDGTKEGIARKALSAVPHPFISDVAWEGLVSSTRSPSSRDIVAFAQFKENTKSLQDNIGSKYNINALNNKNSGSGANRSAASESAVAATPISPVDNTKATVDDINQQSKRNERRAEQLKDQVALSKEADKYIDQINAENAVLTDQTDLLETVRYYKNASYDNQISSQSQLLSALLKSAADLEVAKENLHQEANKIRATTEFDTESWFNADGTESLAYLDLLNSYAGKTDDASNEIVKNIRSTREQLSTFKNGWQENNDKVQALNKSIADTKKEVDELIHAQKIMNLEFQQKELETQEKLYQRALSAVNKTIDNKIEKLKEEKKAIEDANKASEETLQLEQLQESLANAKKQKTIRIYSAAEGWHWEADQNAVKEAEKKIEDFKVQQQLEAIDKQIEGWENYKKEWNDTVNAYNDEQDRLIAIQVLGRDWEQDILDQRIESVSAFRDEYTAILKEIEELQNSILLEQKSMAQRVSGSGGGSGGSGGKMVNVGSDGNAPAGTKVGDTVLTNNGKNAYQVVGKGDTSKTTGGTYNPASGLTSKKVYDTGGELKSGAYALNLSGKPEQILSPEQTRAFHFMMVSVPPMLSDLVSLRNDLKTDFLTSPQSIRDSSTHLTIQNMTVQSNNSTDFMQQMQNLVAITGNSRR